MHGAGPRLRNLAHTLALPHCRCLSDRQPHAAGQQRLHDILAAPVLREEDGRQFVLHDRVGEARPLLQQRL